MEIEDILPLILGFLSSSSNWATLGYLIIAASACVAVLSFFKKTPSSSVVITSADGHKTVISSKGFTESEVATLVKELNSIAAEGSQSRITQSGRTVVVASPGVRLKVDEAEEGDG